MTRSYKFRAWNKKDKKWIDPERFYVGADGDLLSYGNYDDTVCFENDIELMQFTGLLDKNGKEIFEGDVVKTRKQNKEEDVIKYGLSGKMLELPTEVVWENAGFSPLNGWIDEAIKDLEFEIIGNIYENPELLEEECDWCEKNEPELCPEHLAEKHNI